MPGWRRATLDHRPSCCQRRLGQSPLTETLPNSYPVPRWERHIEVDGRAAGVAIGTVAAVNEGPRCNRGSRRARRNWAVTDIASATAAEEEKGHLNTSKSVGIAAGMRL